MGENKSERVEQAIKITERQGDVSRIQFSWLRKKKTHLSWAFVYAKQIESV